MVRRKSDRFKLLQRLAEKREEAAARALGKSQQNLQSQKGRLDELAGFRDGYHQQFHDNGAQGMTGATLQMYQRFMQQLDQAIVQQQGTVAAADDECQRKRQQWQEKHTKTEIYSKTVNKYSDQERLQEHKREQKENDDRPKRK